jgi:hypothetical protein
MISVIRGYHARDSRFMQQRPVESASAQRSLATFSSARLCEATPVSCGKYVLSTAHQFVEDPP